MAKKMHKLQYLRKRKNMSQEDVATYLGISVHAYRKIEQGVRGLSIPTAQKLVKLFEVCHIDDLLDEAV